MFSPVPLPIPAAKTSQDLSTTRFCAACFVDGRTLLSAGTESVSALFERVAPDQARRIVQGEPVYTRLVIFEPAELTIPGATGRS